MKIQDFIKKIASDMRLNNREFSSDDFYFMLKYMGVKKDNSLVLDIEKFYQEFLNSLNNSLVRYEVRTIKSGENATHYIGFYVSQKANHEEAIKVYFPVKYEYIISALKTVFLYLIRNSIKATVKFHVKATNEGIVIRFYDKKDVMPFVNYCNNNFDLKEILEPLNPFIAGVHGIGLVVDDNTVNSYNGTLSDMLMEYFQLLKNSGTLDSASDLDFLDYLMRRINIEENSIVRFNISAIEKNVKAILNKGNPIEITKG